MPVLARVYLGIGSNVGNRLAHLQFAFARLESLLADLRVSPVYETEPLEYEKQPAFLNACVTGRCALTPLDLLDAAQRIETDAGRNRSAEILKGPRSLDIDVLLYGDRVQDDEQLTLPHPGLTARAFALRPLLDLAPDMSDPRTGVRYESFLDGLTGQGIYLATEQPYTRGGGQT
ncbi:MAG: 2-amino-4-hydroxy-6-hydroxymethyldihydropteridine diphosphokinase [Spirochaetes bacterium]|jgi:2-amino-4-hydroxy-6-hydroxymethyldihydropteridine diphosphokinase|nr:2-amino-4-hydroxy-6-hydroxymethyldihydropteridine diphosphokinase [Spirochaetota bacterium]